MDVHCKSEPGPWPDANRYARLSPTIPGYSMEVVFITYESELGVDEIDELFRERAGKYREMDGLLQKFYVHDEESGRVGGIYLFDSPESRDALFDADVHASLRDAYAVTDIEIETYHVTFPLYPVADVSASG